MAGYVAPYTYKGITYNRGDALVLNGKYYTAINNANPDGTLTNQVKYFYGVYVNDDGTLPAHPVGLMNSANQSSVQFAHMNLDAVISIGTSVITPGPFKAYSFDTRTKQTLDAGSWFESVLLDFNSFSSPENDPIVGYNLYYYQSNSDNASSEPKEEQFTGPYLIGTITGQKTLGNVNDDSSASNWGDRGYWFKFGLQAVTQNGTKSLIYESEALRKCFAYLQVFNGNGNTGGKVKDLFQFNGYPYSMPSNGYEKRGHTFAGWSESSNGAGTTYYEGQSVNIAAKSRNWWAKWTKNKYTLTVDPNGGTWNESVEKQTFTQEYTSTKVIAQPTRIGYTFDGWNLTGGGSISGTIYTYGDEDGVLTAKWKRILLTVVLDAASNGGTPNLELNVLYGDSIGRLPVAKKQFYKFVGWFTEKSGGNQIDSSEVITSDRIFFAQFKIDASVKVVKNENKLPAIVWVKVNGVWKKAVAWVKETVKWNKSTGAD